MSAAAQPWLELVVPVPAERQAALITGVIGPWLDTAVRDGGVHAGLFLREPGAPGRSRLIVQARGPARRTRVALGRLAGPVAGTTGGVRDATVVPLSGSAFTGPALGPLTRGFLAAVTPTLVSLTPGTAGAGPARLAAALDLMAAHLPALGPPAAPGAASVTGLLGGAPLSFLSFRSHAEAFIATSRDPAAARRSLDERFETVRGPVEQRLVEILDQVGGRGAVVSQAAARWYAEVVAARPGILAEARRGALTVHDDDPRDPAAFASSTFHTVAGGSAALQNFLHADPAFLAVRLLTSLLYLSLHHLGLSLGERYFLCHAVGRACESVFGVDPVAVLTGLAGA